MKIFILNSTFNGLDLIKSIASQNSIEGIICLDTSKNKNISDYLSNKKVLRLFSKKIINLKSYSINSPEDKKKLLFLNIDILIIAGWQRLIPNWLINHVKVCCIGCHGSPYGITGGKGRSPQNWAIIGGYKNFWLSIFKVNKNIDSGNIIFTKKYKISKSDNILSLYKKTNYHYSNMVNRFLENPEIYLKNTKKQDNSLSKYFPQRLPEDGEIDWSLDATNIINLINALTLPYPGAFFYINNIKITVWSAFILDTHKIKNAKPGKIEFVFNDKSLIISSRTSMICISKWSSSKSIKIEKHLGKIIHFKIWKDNINDIFRRFEKKYPDLVIQKKLYKKLINLK